MKLNSNSVDGPARRNRKKQEQRAGGGKKATMPIFREENTKELGKLLNMHDRALLN